MKRSSEIRKVALIGDYLPRKCGIATFTHDVRTSVAAQFPSIDCFVVPVNDVLAGYDYPPEVRFEIAEQDLDSYLRAADFLNFSNTDVVSLQHEYGIYGGPAGSHILGLLRDLRIPVVTTLHTVLREPSVEQRRVLSQLDELSARLVVMTEKAQSFLTEIYGIPPANIDLIAHGIPDTPFVDPAFYKDQFCVEGKYVVLTFGLLSPNKGIEHMLRALPAVLKAFPNLVYIILGATHPNLVREQGESYRLGLERLARQLGSPEARDLLQSLRRIDRVDRVHRRCRHLRDAVPEPGPDYLRNAGLRLRQRQGRGLHSVLARRGITGRRSRGVGAIRRLRRSGPRDYCPPQGRVTASRNAQAAYLLGREMVWSQIAHRYMDSFHRARRSRADTPLRPLAIRTLDEHLAELPDWRLDHLRRLTDATGIIQHAVYTIPTYAEGYCTDDNARALLLTVLLEQRGPVGPEMARLASTYAAFVQAALVPRPTAFRNFMSYERRWLEKVGSDDCHGRALWALGACVGRSRQPSLPSWAAELFDRACRP